MNNHLSRAQFLFEQGRYQLALDDLGRQLAADPDDPFARCLLALCLSKLKRHEEAIREAQTAVHLAPDLPNGHYVLGSVLDDVGRFKEAVAAAREAIRLDPDDADFYALAASIHAQQRQWPQALALADQGLGIEPDHASCANLKAMALVHLGRKQEAHVTIQGALAKNPENAITHANQGWALLHQSDPTAALAHFREALRLDPEMEWARQGILEALRARNPVYRVLLNYFLWMSRLTTQVRWGVLIGINVFPRILNALAANQPALKPYAEVFFGLYLVFAFLTWTARPLFNLTLRLDPFGRFVLSKRQIIASNWVGSAFLVAALSFVAWLGTQSALAALMAGGFAFITAIVAVTFSGSTVGVRRLTGTLTATAALTLTGILVYSASETAPWLGALIAALLLALLAWNIAAQSAASRRAQP